jgi:hypothetical protein
MASRTGIKSKRAMGLAEGLDEFVTCGSGMTIEGCAVGAMLGAASAWDTTERATKIC